MTPSTPALPTDLAHQRLLLVGGCGGIGRAVASAAVQAGAQVAVLDLPASIARHPLPGVHLLPLDANDPASVDQAVAQARQHLGGIDGCVNLVGFMTAPMALTDTPNEVWHEVMHGNLDSAFYISRAVMPHLRASASGSLVHISSGLGAWARPMYGAYGPAKAGLLLLMRQLALENAPQVRVNAVAPGPVDTAFLRGGTGRSDEQGAPPVPPEALAKLAPMGRMATPQDIVGPVLFLLSGASAYMTGQTLFVNGGAYMP
jgi:3-oxoacyl-[acyl-carrier protein] reductase